MRTTRTPSRRGERGSPSRPRSRSGRCSRAGHRRDRVPHLGHAALALGDGSLRDAAGAGDLLRSTEAASVAGAPSKAWSVSDTTSRYSAPRDPLLQKCGDGHLVARRSTRPEPGPLGGRRIRPAQGIGTRRGRAISKSRRPTSRQSSSAVGVLRPVRIAEAVADRHPHVGVRELGDRGAVAVNVTIEWTIDCGCTTTEMRS